MKPRVMKPVGILFFFIQYISKRLLFQCKFQSSSNKDLNISKDFYSKEHSSKKPLQNIIIYPINLYKKLQAFLLMAKRQVQKQPGEFQGKPEILRSKLLRYGHLKYTIK